MSILITTYEGTHNHPLPASATAMASTTSAAASMLLSGSSSSTQGLGPTASAHMTNTPFYLHNSGSPPFPTVTLDLTATPSTSSSQYNMVSTAFDSTPRFPTTYFGFSASDSNVFPAVFGKSNLAYGTAPFCSRSQDIGSFQTRQPFQEQISQPEYQKNYQVPSQQVLTETLTRAITSDPSFRSIIAAAISTVVAGGSPAQAQSKVEIVGRNLTRDDQETSAV